MYTLVKEIVLVETAIHIFLLLLAITGAISTLPCEPDIGRQHHGALDGTGKYGWRSLLRRSVPTHSKDDSKYL